MIENSAALSIAYAEDEEKQKTAATKLHNTIRSGGYLSTKVKRRMEAASGIVHNEEVPQLKGIKLGRNKPCHCGSGKKHKKCCMRK